MKTIQPKTQFVDSEHDDYEYFDPIAEDGKSMRCVCGYELIKADGDTYKCSGGNHTYRINEGDGMLDKFGNLLLKIPE